MSINPINNANNVYLKSLNNKKLKENQEPQEQSENVSFCGTSALASYNKALVNKNDELFNLPVLKPLDICMDIDKIKGEKIYNSDGELLRINADDGNSKIAYDVYDNKISYVSVTEKDTNTEWIMDYDIETNKIFYVSKKLSDGTEYITFYNNEDGTVEYFGKEYESPNGKSIQVFFYPKDKQYDIVEESNDKYVRKTFDENKKLKSVYDGMKNDTKSTSIDFIDGTPYKIDTHVSKILNTNMGKDDLDMAGLDPHPDYKFVLDKNSIEGEKKYYSNGQLEKVIAKDGTEYSFDLDGRIDTIKNGNKTMEFGYRKNNEVSLKKITEKISDGAEKTTTYWSDGDCSINYEKGSTTKHVSYHSNGQIRHYSKTIDNVEIIDRWYDKNGNLIDRFDK